MVDVSHVGDHDPVGASLWELERCDRSEEEDPDVIQLGVHRHLTFEVRTQHFLVVRIEDPGCDFQLGSHFFAIELQLKRQVEGRVINGERRSANVIKHADKGVPTVFELADVFAKLAKENAHEA